MIVCVYIYDIRVLCVEQSKKRQGGHQLTLQHACKPHSQPITCLAVDTQGQILATGVSTLQHCIVLPSLTHSFF